MGSETGSPEPNRRTSALELPLVRFVWEHYLDVLVDGGKPIGQCLNIRRCYSREIAEKRVVYPHFDRIDRPVRLPEAAVRAPTANSEARKHVYYRNNLVPPPLMLNQSL